MGTAKSNTALPLGFRETWDRLVRRRILFIFSIALRNGEIVSRETLDVMVVQKSTVFGSLGYGYGLMLGSTSYGHAGMWDGYRTEMTIDSNGTSLSEEIF